jgi:DNA invertase Pin-like site-specific DNA recombinase
MKKRAVGYIRVDTTEQTEGTILGTQQEATERYAEDHGFDFI